MDDHRLRARELPRLVGRWLVAGVLPAWVVLTALALEWGTDPGADRASRWLGAMASSSSVVVVLLLLAVPAMVLAPLFRPDRRPGLHEEDLALLAAEVAGAPLKVSVAQGAVPAARPRVAVVSPPVASEPSPPEPADVPEPAPSPSGDDDLDALFR